MSSNVHGRERVKASEELVRKRREREAVKIKQYNDLVQQCQEQFRNENYNHETLSLTTRILEMNPDYYTIWNTRRLVLLRGILVESPQSLNDVEQNRTTYKKELDLFMQLIRINPKSYWMWNHRRWCLETMPKPNWPAELGLVEKLLSLDARNFHGWTYRRYVVRQLRKEAKEKEQDEKIVRSEYDFTTKKINESFSNFSAWYQRTRLLPEIVHNLSVDKKNAIAKDELYLVKEAIYTEPEDQSAWLYYRWIVGHVPDPIQFIGAFKLTSSPLVILIFDDDVSFVSAPTMIEDKTEDTVEGSWLPVGRNSSSSTSTVWVYKPKTANSSPATVRISSSNLMPSTRSKATLTTSLERPIIKIPADDVSATCLARIEERLKTDHWTPSTKRSIPVSSISSQCAWHTLDHARLLKEEIFTVRELLEIEPNSKWALQTLAHFINQLRLLGSCENTDDALAEVISIYEDLAKLDTYRRHRYRDASK
ncbi:hypothetical protein BDB00DRAFT_839847 [Zychaea mexicana]|uniref:uncharacterized protein n=1 Tax=Zychaea mexicana TaxID=64656 RepID=UPI0022FDBD4B|nr:uncharacterized protein BDB00DRAFT_839847 [Zychaea mexicana]KAI9490040.1 hypothetical protein BDB00DRAFT_839847 [Zychaea mexicana]